jgi:quinoprotein glucose dehydrogenase
MPYPEGVPDYTHYTINEYNTVGNRIKPPFTVIVKYDLNQPGIKWKIPYGDDPELAARGITGTSMPGIQNSIIVTESGLVFGAGRDNLIRAWDSDTGEQLWASRFGGNFTGSPAMYETGGKQYLLVPAAGAPAAAGGAGVGTAAAPDSGPPGSASVPLGWVVYTLPQ